MTLMLTISLSPPNDNLIIRRRDLIPAEFYKGVACLIPLCQARSEYRLHGTFNSYLAARGFVCELIVCAFDIPVPESFRVGGR